jgi:negative regulator of sigma E activity
VETNAGGFIDLQLPNSSGLIATKFENTIENQFENETIEEIKWKPKWNPIGFQSVNIETNEIKVEPVVVEKQEIKTEIESVSNLFESVVDKKEHQIEKVVTLDGIFKSNKKPVAFKKRKNDSIQLRQKTDD